MKNSISWKNSFTANDIKGAEKFLNKDSVKDLFDDGKKIVGNVNGVDSFHVEISYGQKGIQNMICSCPMAKSPKKCRHMAAILLAWERMDSNNISLSSNKKEQEGVSFNSQNSKNDCKFDMYKLILCPNCGKIQPNNGTYCGSCLKHFDEMVFQKKNILNPISETIFFSIDNKKDYLKLCYVNDQKGIIFSPSCDNANYKEDYFDDEFSVSNGKIIVNNSIGTAEYERYGEFLYMANTQYFGEIASTNYFEAYCSFNNVCKPIWFLADGRILMFDGIDESLKPSDEGRYFREGNLIRTDIVNKITGKKEISVWLVANGKLCRDVYATEKGIEQIKQIERKSMPLSGGSEYFSSISQKEFFNNYPCKWCNARREWINQEWEYESFGSISASALCRACKRPSIECDEPSEMKRIAYQGNPNPYYHRPVGESGYLDSPCPYCGAYRVRYAKWEDKQMSVAFWGFFSHKLHSKYKCDKCKQMWD